MADIFVINKFIQKSVHTLLKIQSATHEISEAQMVNYKLGRAIDEKELDKYKEKPPRLVR